VIQHQQHPREYVMSTASIITTGPCATRPPAVRPPPFIAGHDDAEPVTIAARTPWAALILTGAIGGVLSGLFAIGGAILMVPLLVWRAGMDQRRAAATSLVAIIPTAVASSATYLVHGAVDVIAAALISAGAIGGAIIGSRLLGRISLTWLRRIFIAFILLVAAHMLVVAPEPVRCLLSATSGSVSSPAWPQACSASGAPSSPYPCWDRCSR
jgi:uncharacterized membrane protein YfcA